VCPSFFVLPRAELKEQGEHHPPVKQFQEVSPLPGTRTGNSERRCGGWGLALRVGEPVIMCSFAAESFLRRWFSLSCSQTASSSKGMPKPMKLCSGRVRVRCAAWLVPRWIDAIAPLALPSGKPKGAVHHGFCPHECAGHADRFGNGFYLHTSTARPPSSLRFQRTSASCVMPTCRGVGCMPLAACSVLCR
jgi:hypothetical protein